MPRTWVPYLETRDLCEFPRTVPPSTEPFPCTVVAKTVYNEMAVCGVHHRALILREARGVHTMSFETFIGRKSKKAWAMKKGKTSAGSRVGNGANRVTRNKAPPPPKKEKKKEERR